jgi:hypothetical protein
MCHPDIPDQSSIPSSARLVTRRRAIASHPLKSETRPPDRKVAPALTSGESGRPLQHGRASLTGSELILSAGFNLCAAIQSIHASSSLSESKQSEGQFEGGSVWVDDPFCQAFWPSSPGRLTVTGHASAATPSQNSLREVWA